MSSLRPPPPCALQCVNELNQWLSALRKVSVNNPGLLSSYHPGIFRGDKWSCCHQKRKSGTSQGPRHPPAMTWCTCHSLDAH